MHAVFLCSIFSGFPVDPWFIFKEIAKISSLLDFLLLGVDDVVLSKFNIQAWAISGDIP